MPATARRDAPVTHVEAPAAAPILKWAGGKRQLLPVLRRYYPREFETYFEPFAGSAAVYFDLYSAGLLAGRRAVLSDVNDDLVGLYRTMRGRLDEIIDALQQFDRDHRTDPGTHYYRVRDEWFNPTRRLLRARHTRWWEHYTPQLAAMLVYLNRTGFNGLFRVNSAGDFNVPIGRHVNPTICDVDRLRKASQSLGRSGVRIAREAFGVSLEKARAGDFVYLDPPYAPLGKSSDFTSYTAGGFSLADQRELQRVVVDLAARGCSVLLSNSTAAEIRELYDDNAEARRVGLRAIKVPARRAINSKATNRGQVLEYVVTNVRPG